MKIAAAVFGEPGAPLGLESLELDDPSGDLVLVRMKASGVCHSDLHVLNGEWPMPDGPIVLGHEGAGIVEAVGERVTEVQPGDHVVLSWFAPCRRCSSCVAGRAWLCRSTRALDNALPDGSSPLSRENGESVAPYLGVAAFAEATLVPESAVVKIPEEVPFPVAALIGCAVTTGVGAVVNAARVLPGESAVVIGCGGVGQSIISGLEIASAEKIIAVDLSEDRLSQARELGATQTIRGDDPRLIERVLEITGGGADYAFEAIGRPQTIRILPELVVQGGKAVLVGLTATGAEVPFEPAKLVDQGKSIIGCNYGNSVPSIDFRRMTSLYLRGKLPLDRLIGREVDLNEVNEAFEDLAAGAGLRTIIRFP